MSEYQYYEFQAVDHPLTDSQMRELRQYSGRATITPTRFVNVYNWGDFKGDRREWMEKYFDAFLYVANWGSHWLEFRIPKRLLGPKTVSAYCTNESLSCRAKGDFVVVSFASEDQDGEWAEGEGWLASLMPLRADLMNGDLRCLYLGWLVAAQAGFLEEDEPEPPVPPGLGTLGSPLRTFADFLRIEPDWIAAAAEESADMQAEALTPGEIASYAAQMPPTEKDAVIAALIEGRDAHFAAEFRQRAMRAIRPAGQPNGENTGARRRTVDELAARAATMARERRQQAAEARAHKQALKEREQAEARRKHLKSLAGKEDSLWTRVDKLIATRQPNRYDEAISLLQDLRDLHAMGGRDSAFRKRMEALCREHMRKPALLKRFGQAGLMASHDLP